MKVVALVSGGKDSIMAMMECVRFGHEIVCLANLHPLDQAVQELDSYCFQTVGTSAVPAFAECMGIPIVRHPIRGTAVCQSLAYDASDADEVEDLFGLLSAVKDQFPEVEAICSGAILSDYQRLRVENVSARLGLLSYAFLWRRDQKELYDEMIMSGIVAIIIKTACLGLIPTEHIGQDLQSMRRHLMSLADSHGCNPCGEGGEYETFVIDCPLFRRHIVLDECTIEGEIHDPICPVGHLRVMSFHTEPKLPGELEALLAFKAQGILPPSPRIQTKPTESEATSTSITIDDNSCPMVEIFDQRLDGSAFASIFVEGIGSEELFANAGAIQNRLGLAVDDCFFVSLLLSSLAMFDVVNAAYKRHFGLKNPPTRCCIETVLPKGVFAQMELVFFRGDRTVLHVQSISRWAPACIGPYSQATRIGSLLILAGQIALSPEHMVLMHSGDPVEQANLCLDHCSAILAAFSARLAHVFQVAVFVTTDMLECVQQIRELLKWRLVSATIFFVPCRALPRGASVELAVIGDMGEQFDESSVTSGSGGFRWRTDVIASTGELSDEPFVSSVCSLSCVPGAHMNLGPALISALTITRNAMAKRSMMLDSIVQVRTYYSPGVDPDVLRSRIMALLGMGISIAMIPMACDAVSADGKSQAILSIVAKRDRPSDLMLESGILYERQEQHQYTD